MREFDSDILNLNARVVFFPIRHHSPACSRILRQLVCELRLSAILIEGPSDYNSQISELFLPHKLPVAIYSYTRLTDGTRQGAFYPFCVYSPEWQALKISQELNIPAQFIDLPWAEIANLASEHDHSLEMELHNSSYVSALCEKLGVEGLHDLWDLLFEINPLTPKEYLERCHKFCFHSRMSDDSLTASPREDFMVSQIRQALSTYSGQILVVTGGFHSYAVYTKIYDRSSPEPATPSNLTIPTQLRETGIALTPFSYQRLDSLSGYDAGMPNPGFYDQVWHDRLRGDNDTYRQILVQVVKDLRSRNQVFSSADLIAVEVTAKGLAALRGNSVVWRQDLIDGITAALIKEELNPQRTHPFLAAVYNVLRGDVQGRLADGTSLPPLVQNIQQLLQQYDLEPTKEGRGIDLNLHLPVELEKSHILHQLRILNIAGYSRINGSDLVSRRDLSYIWEQWAIAWSPHYEASCIENAIYGTTLAEAAEARLLERAREMERDAVQAALLLLDACLLGWRHLATSFYQQLAELIRAHSDLLSVTEALGHMLYLYCYDEVLGTAGQVEIGRLVVETFTRSLWLLESLGQVEGQQLLSGMKVLLETFERCLSLDLNRDEFMSILQRVNTDAQTPMLRGAACGVLWTLAAGCDRQVNNRQSPNLKSHEQLLLNLRSCAQPHLIGDFLTGLFYLAREVVQRYPDLLLSIDALITSFDEETFLAALPALHLAFTYFTPREKHNIASTLVKAWGDEESQPPIEVSAEVVAQVLAFETKLFTAIKRYGLRSGNY